MKKRTKKQQAFKDFRWLVSFLQDEVRESIDGNNDEVYAKSVDEIDEVEKRLETYIKTRR